MKKFSIDLGVPSIGGFVELTCVAKDKAEALEKLKNDSFGFKLGMVIVGHGELDVSVDDFFDGTADDFYNGSAEDVYGKSEE